MANRPGVLITSRSAPPPRGISSDTGVWFVVGTAEKGSLASAQLVRNMTEFQLYYGTRQTYSLLWDSLETYFREGGTEAYVARVTGPSATVAGRNLLDSGAGNSLRVDAKNAGVWGNSLSVAVVAGTPSGYVLVVTHSTLGEVDRSPTLVTQADAINWSRNSAWINVSLPTSPTALAPAVAAAAALSAGADDNTNTTDTARQTALGFFTGNLGPGQVSIPGNVTTANRTALIAHARTYNRLALLDVTDTPTRSALVTEANSLQGDEYGALFGPWIVVPGLVPNTTRTVPPTALAAALMARSDSTNSPNVPAAGDNGLARWAFDLTQPPWTETDRDLLNSAGVNLFRDFNDGVRLYGFRSLANPAVDVSWLNLANQRLRMEITAEARNVAKSFLFSQIDGKGLKIAEFDGALTGLLSKYYAEGALYGNTSDEAFSIDVGSSVNTPTTIANNELHAVLSLRMSPMAELVQIEIVKVPITQSV